MSNHPELAHQTDFTRTGKMNMINRKPYRTARQKEIARSTANKGRDGAYHSNAPVSFHSRAKEQAK